MPCRVGSGPRKHHCSWQHHDLVEGYRVAAKAQELRAEEATHGYDTELATYFHRDDGVERRLTFKTWLIQSTDRSLEEWEDEDEPAEPEGEHA